MRVERASPASSGIGHVVGMEARNPTGADVANKRMVVPEGVTQPADCFPTPDIGDKVVDQHCGTGVVDAEEV